MKNYKITSVQVILLCFIISISIFIIDSIIPLGVAGGVPYIIVVLISLWSTSKNITYYVALSVSILTILGFYTSPSGGELWQVLFNRGIALFAIWITAILTIQRKIIYDEKESVFNEFKILKGIIPICSYCHSIRNVDNDWDQLEAYISNHSNAEFSHGVCPKCLSKVRAEAGLK